MLAWMMVARPQRVGRRVDQRQDAFLLVVAGAHSTGTAPPAGGGQHAEHDLPRQAGEEEHEAGGTDQDRGAEVGCLATSANGTSSSSAAMAKWRNFSAASVFCGNTRPASAASRSS